MRSLQREDYAKNTVTDVEKTGITRLVVTGLKYGVDGFAARYGPGPKDVSSERNKTKESPSHRALVLLPDMLDPTQPVQIVVHFHGWGFRFRRERSRSLRRLPLVAKGGKKRPAAGNVRDVDKEHWEQQIGSLKGPGPRRFASRSSPRVEGSQTSASSRRSSTSATCS